MSGKVNQMRLHGLMGEIEIRRVRGGKEDLILKQPMRSFTRQFKHWLVNILSGSGRAGFNQLPVIPTTGELYWNAPVAYLYYYHIVNHVGIGNNGDPFNYNDTQLHGFLTYETGKTVSVQPSDTDSSTVFELTATFNITFSDTIRETGLYGTTYSMKADGTIVGWKDFLVSRDVLSNPVDVVPGDVLIVRYRISVS